MNRLKDDARVHAGEGERTDERISHDLERQRRERFIVIRLAGELLFGVIDVGTLGTYFGFYL